MARKIGTTAFWLYAAPGYAERPSADWAFIAYDSKLDHVVEQQWLRTFAAGRPVVFRANDLARQAAAARAGVRIAMLPCFLAYQDPGLAALPMDFKRATRDIYLVVHSDLRRMPAIRAVLQFVAEQVASFMPPPGA